jgi:hypothetical protein
MHRTTASGLLLALLLIPTSMLAQKKAPPGKSGTSTTDTTATTTTTTTTTTTESPTTTTSTSSSESGDFAYTRSKTCSESPYTRLVNVSTATQLASALTNARPGDKIVLADGTYSGRFRSSVAGTAASPILLCGSRSAVINSGATSSGGYTFLITGGYWVIDGFTITNTMQGIRFVNSRGSVIRRMRIYNVGLEAISFKGFSSRNIVEENLIHDVGLYKPEYGEAVYIGSAQSVWCTFSNCEPDRSDSNVVRNNTLGPKIGAQMVDIKEGTTGTVVVGNTFDGRGQSPSMTEWVLVLGNDARVMNNRGSVTYKDGYRVAQGVTGWGQRAVFSGNSSDLTGGTGYGYNIGSNPAKSVRYECTNVNANAVLGDTNGVPCVK